MYNESFLYQLICRHENGITFIYFNLFTLKTMFKRAILNFIRQLCHISKLGPLTSGVVGFPTLTQVIVKVRGHVKKE